MVYAVVVCPSVCSSVCPSDAGIVPRYYLLCSAHILSLKCLRLPATRKWRATPNVKILVLNHPLGELGVTHRVHLWLGGKRVVDFLLAIFELFSLALTAYAEPRGARRYIVKSISIGTIKYKLAVLIQYRPLFGTPLGWPSCNFAEIFGTRKLKSLGNRTSLFARSYVYPFWYNTGVWWTDGQTDGWTDTRRQHIAR